MSQRPRLFASIVFLCLAAVTPMRGQNTATGNFSYSGDLGPGFWGTRVAKECAGSRQSPIDINRVHEDSKLEPLNLTLPRLGVKLTNTGYTIMGATDAGGLLVIDGKTYALDQFHFHTFSEHTIEGRRGVMELHVVFKDSNGELAVIGVLYRIGRLNPFLRHLIAAGLPDRSGAPAVPLKRVYLGAALTDTASYYTYPGSLTTPGCAEKVKWLVLKQWAELSPDQFDAFRTILGNDFRPLQDRNDRVILATKPRPEDDGNEASSAGPQ